MSQKYEKLKTLLKEVFQLDQPDLDFGLYRIMHAKATLLGKIGIDAIKDACPHFAAWLKRLEELGEAT